METKLNNIILVPTDFSEVCENAINHAAVAAEFLNYKLCILHVVNQETKSFLKKQDQHISFLEDNLKTIVESIEKKYVVSAEYLIKEGSIFDLIGDVAKDIKASLLVLGTHGKSGFQHITGSFALKVISSSPVPVIVVQKTQFDKGVNKIVLRLTSDAGPWEKTKWAAYIAKQFDAKIYLFQVNDESNINRAAKIITDFFDENDVKYEVSIAEKHGNFTDAAIYYTAGISADMIMIMTNPDKQFTKFLLGSYDEQLIFNTPQIPVMCINPRDFNWKKIVSY